jgi:hypothetical protein
MKSNIFVCLVVTSAALGQATFDVQAPVCGAVFPIGCGASGDPELISWNGILSGTGVLPSPGPAMVDATVNGVGFPTGGAQYGRLHAAGPVTVPMGGPSPETGASNQIYLPIPPGASTVSFNWDFYNADSTSSALYNDGMAVDVIAVCPGPSIGNLVYVDSFTPVSGLLVDTACANPAGAGLGDVAPFGAPNTFGPAAFPGGIPPFGSFLRIQVWNGGDNTFSSRGVVDTVVFGFGPVPCSLQFTSPFGPGSIQMDNTPCPAVAGASYFNPITLLPGVFPGGWFFGLDITFTDLANQFYTGYPFTGGLDATGASTFGPVAAPFLSGLTLYGVTTHFTLGFGSFISARAPVSYTIP